MIDAHTRQRYLEFTKGTSRWVSGDQAREIVKKLLDALPKPPEPKAPLLCMHGVNVQQVCEACGKMALAMANPRADSTSSFGGVPMNGQSIHLRG